MSWSDHKDDKSRFDGWREFLTEGKEQQPEQVIKEELDNVTEALQQKVGSYDSDREQFITPEDFDDDGKYNPFGSSAGENAEIDGPTTIYEKRADGVLRHLTDVQDGSKALITIGPVKDLAESEQMLALETFDTSAAGDEVGGMSLKQKKKQCAEDGGTWEDGHCNKAKNKPPSRDPMDPENPLVKSSHERTRKMRDMLPKSAR